MTDTVGGYHCPYCRYRAVVDVLVQDHIAREHPEETR